MRLSLNYHNLIVQDVNLHRYIDLGTLFQNVLLVWVISDINQVVHPKNSNQIYIQTVFLVNLGVQIRDGDPDHLNTGQWNKYFAENCQVLYYKRNNLLRGRQEFVEHTLGIDKLMQTLKMSSYLVESQFECSGEFFILVFSEVFDECFSVYFQLPWIYSTKATHQTIHQGRTIL